MENKKEMIAPDVSVGADTEQPTSKNTTSSISENGGNIKSFEELQREMQLRSDPSYLEKKLDRMVMRDLYGKFKTAPTEEERERARKEYLDRRGVQESFRW